jgi:hypothetical protein
MPGQFEFYLWVLVIVMMMLGAFIMGALGVTSATP